MAIPVKRKRRTLPKVRYILHDTNAKEPTHVFLTIRINTKRVKWSTGLRIEPKNWNKASHRAVTKRSFPKARGFNLKLDQFEQMALSLFDEWHLNTSKGISTYGPEDFRQEMYYRAGVMERPKTKTDHLSEADFISFAESLRDYRKDATDIVRGTWKVLNNHVNLLREYADLKHGGTVQFHHVDDLFIDGFKKFLFRIKNHNRRTVHKVLVTLRSIARKASERRLMEYGDKFRKWTRQDYRKLPQPALNRFELDSFMSLDLSQTPRLEKVRDLFLIGVVTAQRFSDYSNLSPKNFIKVPGGRYRFYIPSQRKTASPASGPVMSWAVSILERYGYIGDGPFKPPKISGPKFNEYLKEVAKLAIPDSVITIYNDGEKLDHVGTEQPKWSVITSHAARRTAVGLLRSMKVPDDQIQRMTGHKNVAELTTYDVRDAEVLAIDLGKTLDTSWNRRKLHAAE